MRKVFSPKLFGQTFAIGNPPRLKKTQTHFSQVSLYHKKERKTLKNSPREKV